MRRVRVLFALLLGLALGETAWGAVENLNAFAAIPVMENGRILPMDSFARLKLAEFSGRQSLPLGGTGFKTKREPAVSWMARVLFEPSSTFSNKVFVVDNPEVLEAIGVAQAPHEDFRRYSFDTLRPAMGALNEKAQGVMHIPEEKQSLADKEILRLYVAVNNYLSMISSFTFAQPHPDFAIPSAKAKEAIGLTAEQAMFSYLDMRGVIEKIRAIIEGAKDRSPEQWNEVEQGAFAVAQSMYTWTQRFQGTGVTMIPADPHGGQDWLTGWGALSLGLQDIELNNALLAIGRLPAAWITGDQKAFDSAANSYRDFVKTREGSHREVRLSAAEAAFNRASLLSNAKALYILTFILSFFVMLTGNRPLRWVATGTLLLAFALHATALGWRIWLTARPPVTNLYGTFLFVGVIAVLLGILAERLLRNGAGTFVAAVCGASLLFIAGRYELQGDTMGKMVAVLNSNFWLTTHVLTISMGYAGCFLASIMGIVYLVMRAKMKPASETLGLFYRVMLGVLAFGFTFAFLGTMLGGVWADQSWGRFWGWDPKENGALLIVLWCAVLYHARIGGFLRDTGMAAGSALGGIWVILAWFGTNLLGVGLHSYGFTTGAAMRIYIYVGVMVLLVAGLVTWVRFADNSRHLATTAPATH